jgi:hypothetical protein
MNEWMGARLRATLCDCVFACACACVCVCACAAEESARTAELTDPFGLAVMTYDTGFKVGANVLKGSNQQVLLLTSWLTYDTGFKVEGCLW